MLRIFVIYAERLDFSVTGTGYPVWTSLCHSSKCLIIRVYFPCSFPHPFISISYDCACNFPCEMLLYWILLLIVWSPHSMPFCFPPRICLPPTSLLLFTTFISHYILAWLSVLGYMSHIPHNSLTSPLLWGRCTPGELCHLIPLL